MHLKLYCIFELHQDLKRQSLILSRSLRLCISNRLPGDVNVVLWEASPLASKLFSRGGWQSAYVLEHKLANYGTSHSHNRGPNRAKKPLFPYMIWICGLWGENSLHWGFWTRSRWSWAADSPLLGHMKRCCPTEWSRIENRPKSNESLN